MVFGVEQERKRPQIRDQLRAEGSELVNERLVRMAVGTSDIEKQIRRLLIRIAFKRHYSSVEIIRARKIIQTAPLLSARACRSDLMLLAVYERLGAFQAQCMDE